MGIAGVLEAVRGSKGPGEEVCARGNGGDEVEVEESSRGDRSLAGSNLGESDVRGSVEGSGSDREEVGERGWSKAFR